MGANDRAVDHQILIVSISRERLKHSFPYACMAPAAEALVYGLSFAVPLWQIVPMGARTQNPKAAIDKQAVVRASASRIASLSRQQARNPANS